MGKSPPTGKKVSRIYKKRKLFEKIWSEADKQIFLKMVKIHGQNYESIQSGIPKKSIKQVRNYWMNNHRKLPLKKLARIADRSKVATSLTDDNLGLGFINNSVDVE